MARHLIHLPLLVLLILTTGCKKDEADEETTGDLCREQCDLSAEACPEDSLGGQSADFCKFLCAAYESTDSCYEKFEIYMTCLASHEPVCDGLSGSTLCEEEAAPFAIDGSGANMHGECVKEGVTAE